MNDQQKEPVNADFRQGLAGVHSSATGGSPAAARGCPTVAR
jgi:hypothetical protein